jgi:Asp-tRNA(Asn)/Glu-tRNA(Gln) amidotransferase A subunit family amidase
MTTTTGSYDPREFRALTWHDVVPHLRDGTDDPRAYLERCLETIAAREPVVKAFVVLNEAGARTAADASRARWKAGRPLSPIDGMPVAIKDLLETRDMPTEMGCEAYCGNFPKRDNAAVWALRAAGAIILGKTVTAELGGSQRAPERQQHGPLQPRRFAQNANGLAARIGEDLRGSGRLDP